VVFVDERGHVSTSEVSILQGVDLPWIAFALLELLVGVGVFAASRRALRRARERGGLMRAVHPVLHVLGVVLILYGLLQLLFGLF
jgi:hypothetical protein